MSIFPATPTNSDQLKKIQLPLILMVVLGAARIILNVLGFPGLSELTWNPLRIGQNLIYDRFYWGLFDADYVSIFGGEWLISDIPTRLFSLFAILALVKALPVKQASPIFGVLTLISVLVSVIRLIRFNIQVSGWGFSDMLKFHIAVVPTSWLLYGFLTAWIFLILRPISPMNTILPQAFPTNVKDQEGSRTVQPPLDTPPQGFGATPSFGVIDANKPQFRLQMFGAGDRLFTLMELRALADTKSLQPSTLVLQDGVGFAMPASTIPGIFSKKTWLVALLLALFVGTLGIDRFYLGHIGIGIAKLLTFGGCGVWALIDLVLIAMRKVKDSDGLQLS